MCCKEQICRSMEGLSPTVVAHAPTCHHSRSITLVVSLFDRSAKVTLVRAATGPHARPECSANSSHASSLSITCFHALIVSPMRPHSDNYPNPSLPSASSMCVPRIQLIWSVNSTHGPSSTRIAGLNPVHLKLKGNVKRA
jgi:hypothetical protein